jgi:hypothetical protein
MEVVMIDDWIESRRLCVVCTFIALAPQLCVAEPSQTPQQRIQAKIVLLEVTGQDDLKHDHTALGTGFIISKDGFALTSAHLYDDLIHENKVIPATIKTIARVGGVASTEVNVGPYELERDGHDVALIKLDPSPRVEGYDFAKLMCNTSFELAGRSVYTLGFYSQCLATCLQQRPWLSAGGEGKVGPSGGDVSPDTRSLIGYHFNDGNSGSPVFSSGGIVIGVVKGNNVSDANASAFVPLSFGSSLLIQVPGLVPCVNFSACVAENENAGETVEQTGIVETARTNLFHVESKADQVCLRVSGSFKLVRDRVKKSNDENIGGRGRVSGISFSNDQQACVDIKAWSDSTIFGEKGRQKITLTGISRGVNQFDSATEQECFNNSR